MTTKQGGVINGLGVGALVLMFSVIIVSCATTNARLGEPVSSDWPDLRIRHDEFNNVSFIRSATLNGIISDAPLELYIAHDENIKTLRLRTKYYGISWIFFDSAILINDKGGKTQYFFADVNRSAGSGGVVESGDIQLSSFNAGDTSVLSLEAGQHTAPQKIKELSELLNGTNIRLRLSGDSHREYTISESHVTALRNVIAYYESITAKIE